MPTKRMQLATWEKITEAGVPAKLLGLSPGGAAGELGISRQGVHDAIRRGALDAFAVYRGTRLLFHIIPQPSLDAYKKRVREKAEAVVRRLDTSQRVG